MYNVFFNDDFTQSRKILFIGEYTLFPFIGNLMYLCRNLVFQILRKEKEKVKHAFLHSIKRAPPSQPFFFAFYLNTDMLELDDDNE